MKNLNIPLTVRVLQLKPAFKQICTIVVILIFFATNSFAQSSKMLRVEYLNANILHNGICTNPNGIAGPNYTYNIALNNLLNNYNVSYYAPYYSKDVLDSTLKNFYAIYLSGNADSFKTQLTSLNLTNQIEILMPDSIECSNPVQINDYPLVSGWMNNDAINLCDAQCGWTITKGDPNIRVAIADTDFELTHDDLKNRIREAYGPITSQHEHGTTVLGTAGAEPNTIGMVGTGYNLLWDGSRVPHSIFSGGASGNPAVGITNAVNKGARVINVSWTGTGYTRTAVQDLVNRGFILVVAAGNSPSAASNYDIGDIPGVILVSGVNKDGYHGPTNHARNNRVELCAMSINVSCTKNNNSYGGAWGTSNAAPQVTAAAGLILSLNPCFTPAQVEYILMNTTKPILDASTYSGLVGTGFLDLYSALKFAAGRSGTLAANETWTKMEIISGDLIVPSGKTLTIKSQVWCYNNASITIKPGGKVLIDGGNLASLCGSWKGIRVEGTANQNQTNLANVGFLQMINNAIIADASNAVSLIGLNSSGGLDWSKTGGLIQATNSQFVNNLRDVEFMSYHPKSSTGVELPNRSYFTNCKFVTNDNLKFWNNGHAHVTMWDVNGVKFYGCSFENNRTYINSKNTLARKGIYTINSNFTVASYCSNPLQIPCTGVPSKFINLNSAIESYSNGTKGIIAIENSQFSSYKGTFLQGTNGSVVRSNNFTIGHDVVIANNTDYPYGLYLDKCQQFNTEGNQFTGTTGSANVTQGGAAGLVIRNTGANNNDFYRCYFDNLKMASQALSGNRDINLTTGLSFRCNDYEQSWNDLDVRNDPNNTSPTTGNLGMKELQGQTMGANPTNPDNIFANTGSFINFNIENRGNWMQYVYSGSAIQANRLFPFAVTSNVTRLQFSNPLTCPNRINNWGIQQEPLFTKIGILGPQMVLKRNQLNGLTDGGNTAGLKASIASANTNNVVAVVGQLLGFSPHLSNEVLALVAQQNSPFTNEMIRDVLVANPHSSRCLWVQTNLDNRSNQLSSTYRNQIIAGLNIKTQRDSLGAELSAITEDYDLTLHELLYAYYSDTNSIITDYASLLKHPTNPTYHYQLAELYFDNGDWAKYLLIKDSIPNKFHLDERQVSYHTSFSNLFSELHNWQNSNLPFYSPDSARKQWLLNFANNNLFSPARIHALLAINDTFINHPDVYIPVAESGQPNAMWMDIVAIEKENSHSTVNLYPNPAIDVVTLAWKTGAVKSQVKVFDVNGKIINETLWEDADKLIINTADWPVGLYFVKITKANSKETITRKLIITR
jgi:hypothetical protein